MIARPHVLALLALLSLALVACGEEAAEPEAAHQHSAHQHGPQGGDLVKVTDGVWFEVTVIHDEAAMVVWTYTGELGNLKPAKMQHQPVLAFTFENAEAKVEGAPYPDAGENAFKFIHAGLGWDIPDADLSAQVGDNVHTVAVPAHHH